MRTIIHTLDLHAPAGLWEPGCLAAMHQGREAACMACCGLQRCQMPIHPLHLALLAGHSADCMTSCCPHATFSCPVFGQPRQGATLRLCAVRWL